MDKKAQGLSINVIIIVAIALIVLVVLVAIFTGRLGVFSEGIKKTVTCRSSCESLGMKMGTQVEGTDDGIKSCTDQDVGHARYVIGTFSDVDVGKFCCCNV